MALAAAPEVRASTDIRNAGEIILVVSFCGPAGPNGTVVDVVGESFSAVAGSSGSVTLRYVPTGYDFAGWGPARQMAPVCANPPVAF